jgi:ABC-type glycerol-3-phosphate transport system substrate-binding protein
MASVSGLVLLVLALQAGLAFFRPPPVTVAVSYKDAHELIGINDMGHALEDKLGGKMVLKYTDLRGMAPRLEEMVAAGTMQWDLIIVDNDTLGILVQKGLVQDLSQYRPYAQLIPGALLASLKQLEPKVDGRYYFVPFRANVKLTYYDAEALQKAGYKQPPITWEALQQVAHALKGRVAIQAHPGKAAAVTMFEFVTAMGGNPLTLADEGARQAFTHLWNLAPYLASESTTIQFDSANEMLINDKISLISNWTYGIKVVIENAGKTNIRVSPGALEGGTHVMGGDLLAIPVGAPHPEQAIKLIELLVAKQTQRALAENLFWAPVREDVYDELSVQAWPEEWREHFRVIREALRTAVLRPTTPEWGLVEEVLSDALQAVLRQGAQGEPATAAAIDELLKPYADRLQEIPREYMACAVVPKKTARKGSCEVEVQTEKSFEELARDFQTTPTILAKINGRNDWQPVSPKNMKILLVPKPLPGS